MVGCPETIGDGFYCGGNVFTSLHGGPKYVGGDFNCCGNVVNLVVGCPEIIVGKMIADVDLEKISKLRHEIKVILESLKDF